MKYIRTKEGKIIAFKPKEKYENDKTTFDWFVANYCGGGINVLKVADTIEELCDEFVDYEAKNDKGEMEHFVFREWEYVKNINDLWKYIPKKYKKEWAIYGAIWTDKGLIYVAKMNDKGELELL